MFKIMILIVLINVTPALSSTQLKIFNTEKNQDLTFCHAQYISNNTYYTAAHCVIGIKANEIKINGNSISQIIHHNYYKKNYIYDQLDFAILKVENTENINVLIKEPRINEVVFIQGFKGIIAEIYSTEFKVKFSGKAVCLNDSGSGIFSGNYLLGILSRGSKKCQDFAYMTKASIINLWHKDNSVIKQFSIEASKKFIKRLIFFNLRTKYDKKN